MGGTCVGESYTEVGGICEYGRWEEYGREGSSGAYLSRKRGAAASQGQRNRFWKIQEIDFVQNLGDYSFLSLTTILNFENLSWAEKVESWF